MNTDDYKYGITVEYEGQEENMIAVCKLEHNAFMIGSYILESLKAKPIVRVVNLEEEKCLGAFQKDVKQLESKSGIFS